MTPFQHGGDIVTFAKHCHCTPEEIIDLSSNINFVKPHLNTDFNRVNIAPYPNDDRLQNAIASHYGVAYDELALFNGASTAIYALFAYLRYHTVNPPNHIILYDPIYLEYKRAAALYGFEAIHIDRFTALDKEVPDNALVIFVNPATPDGLTYTMMPLLETWIAKGCHILIDESFLEFTQVPSLVYRFRDYPKLWILKSMTKFFGAAGVRVGTLLSNATNISAFTPTLPPWRLSTFDSTYILEALKDKAFAHRSTDSNRKAKEVLTALLDTSPLVADRYEGEANFVLVKLHIAATKLQEMLLPYHTLIRDCSNFDGLDGYHVRIAVKEVEKFKGLQEVLRA